MQKNNIVSFMLGSIVIAIVTIVVFSQPTSSQKKSIINTSTPSYTSSSVSEKSTSITYSSSEVEKHNNILDCWSTVNGEIYNLTSWIKEHPSGEGAILNICGKDGSLAFNNQHGEKRKPNKILTTFKIGTLAQ